MKKNIRILIIFLVLGSVAGWLYYKQTSTTLKPELRDFVVADTTSIDKIFMADKQGNAVTLTKKSPGQWIVNGKYNARNSCINTLLYTIKSMEVRSPVGKNLYNHTMKLMASSSVKTEIYQKGSLVKTYYVGHPSMDNQGTFMYLEGSSVPFIMHIPGFVGYLSTRYFASENEWKEHSIFRFNPRDISDIKIENYASQHRSFELKLGIDSSYSLTTLANNKTISPLDPVKLKKYLNFFQGVNYEREDTHLSKSQHDSLLIAGPFASVSVMDANGRNAKLSLFRMPVNQYTKEPKNAETGKDFPYDMDKFTVQLVGDTTWYICQYFHFDNVLKDPLNFQPGPDKTAPQKRD